jgi:hypothetical protein
MAGLWHQKEKREWLYRGPERSSIYGLYLGEVDKEDSWIDPFPISKGERLINLVQDKKGVFWLIWQDDKIKSTSSPDGRRWEEPRSLPPFINTHNGVRDPCLIQGRDGRFFLVWRSGLSPEPLISWTRDMRRWSFPIKMKHLHSPGRLFQDNNGRYLFLWNDAHNIYAVSSIDGINWGSTTPLFTSKEEGVISSYDLIQDKKGRYWLVYIKEREIEEEGKPHDLEMLFYRMLGALNIRSYKILNIFVTSSLDGENWQRPRSIFTSKSTGASIRSPSLFQDLKGNYILSWLYLGESSDEEGIHLLISQDGIDWGSPKALPYPRVGGIYGRYSLTQALDGRYWLVWSGLQRIWATATKEAEDVIPTVEPTVVSGSKLEFICFLFELLFGQQLLAITAIILIPTISLIIWRYRLRVRREDK